MLHTYCRCTKAPTYMCLSTRLLSFANSEFAPVLSPAGTCLLIDLDRMLGRGLFRNSDDMFAGGAVPECCELLERVRVRRRRLLLHRDNSTSSIANH